jgi:hypothetical protein
MIKKKLFINRKDASSLRPKKLKPFSLKKFIIRSKQLQKAVEKETKKDFHLANDYPCFA